MVTGSRRFQITGLTKTIIQKVYAEGEQSINTLTGECSGATLGTSNLEALGRVLRDLSDCGVLARVGVAQTAFSTSDKKRSRNYFLFRIPLISAETLLPLTKFCARMLHPRVVAMLLPVLVIAHAVLWVHWSSSFRASAAKITGLDFAFVLVCNYCGLFAHELGHAVACVRSGVKHGAIGFCIFLVFPGLYTDVTESYKLDRPGRLLVDSGGVFASLVCASIAAVLAYLTAYDGFRVLTGVFTATAWISLMPFTKMDGYWIISDLLGIPNLSMMNRDTTRWVLHAAVGCRAPVPSVFRIRLRWISMTYLAHYITSSLFVIWLTWRLASWYVVAISQRIPVATVHVLANVAKDGISIHTIRGIAGLVLLFVPLATGSVFVASRVRALARAYKSIRAALAQRSAHRPESSINVGKAETDGSVEQ